MMKRVFLICVLLFILPTLSFSKDKEIDASKLQNRNGIAYEINQEEPYTGKVVEFYKNGQKKYEVNFKNGHQNGLKTQWNEKGPKISEEKYSKGQLMGYITYNNDGTINSRWGMAPCSCRVSAAGLVDAIVMCCLARFEETEWMNAQGHFCGLFL
jgi:hypothetical protein